MICQSQYRMKIMTASLPLKTNLNKMKNNEFTLDELHEKIRLGLDLAFKKLVAEKKKNNGVFVFSKNGKIVEVKAVDFKG